MLKDEQGKWSTGRGLLWLFSVAGVYYILTRQTPDPVALSWLSTALMAVIGWVGGARIGQYIFPGLSKVPLAMAQAKIAERDHGMGIQPTGEQ
jgi:hypothetical protein